MKIRPNTCHAFPDSRVYYFEGYALHARGEEFVKRVRATGRKVCMSSAPYPYRDDQSHDDFVKVIVWR